MKRHYQPPTVLMTIHNHKGDATPGELFFTGTLVVKSILFAAKAVAKSLIPGEGQPKVEWLN